MMKKKILIMMLMIGAILLISGLTSAQEEQQDMIDQQNNNKTLLILGCAIAVGISGISAATGLTFSGTAAVAVAAEKPNVGGSKLLVLQVLPMTQSVYGLLTAILMLMGAGLLSGSTSAAMSNPIVGPAAIFIGIVIALTSTSAINQGIIAASSINAVGRNPDVFSKGVIYAVTTETMAIFGLLTAIFMMVGLGLL